MDQYEALGEITRERGLEMFSREAMLQAIRRMQEGTYVVSIKKLREKRSDRQNRYWHGVVIPYFAEHCGEDFDDMKDVLALELLPKEIVDLKTGEVRTIPGHTSELDTKQFADLIDRAIRLAASMKLEIPTPEQAGYEIPAQRAKGA